MRRLFGHGAIYLSPELDILYEHRWMKAGTDSSKVRTECGQQLTGKGWGGIGIDRRRIQTVTVECVQKSSKIDLQYQPLISRYRSAG